MVQNEWLKKTETYNHIHNMSLANVHVQYTLSIESYNIESDYILVFQIFQYTLKLHEIGGVSPKQCTQKIIGFK